MKRGRRKREGEAGKKAIYKESTLSKNMRKKRKTTIAKKQKFLIAWN